MIKGGLYPHHSLVGQILTGHIPHPHSPIARESERADTMQNRDIGVLETNAKTDPPNLRTDGIKTRPVTEYLIITAH